VHRLATWKKSTSFWRRRFRTSNGWPAGTQDAFYILKNCFSLPKLQYILRCYSSQVLLNYNNLIHDTLQSILNVILTESIWEQATLPVRNDRIWVRLAAQVAVPVVSSSKLAISSARLRCRRLVETTNRTGSAARVHRHLSESPSNECCLPHPTTPGSPALLRPQLLIFGAFLQMLPCSAVGPWLDDLSQSVRVVDGLG